MITHAASGWIFREWNENKMSPICFTEIVLVFVRFLCRNFSFYFVLVFWITIIQVLVLWKRRPIILVLVLIFVTKITLVRCYWQSANDWRADDWWEMLVMVTNAGNSNEQEVSQEAEGNDQLVNECGEPICVSHMQASNEVNIFQTVTCPQPTTCICCH